MKQLKKASAAVKGGIIGAIIILLGGIISGFEKGHYELTKIYFSTVFVGGGGGLLIGMFIDISRSEQKKENNE